MDVQTKTCSKCGIDKTLGEFYKDKAGRLGVRPDCKECVKIYNQTPERKARRKLYDQSAERKAYHKIHCQDPEYKERERLRQQSPQYKAQQKAYAKTPEQQAKQRARNATPERRAQKKAWHQTPEQRARQQSPERKIYRKTYKKNRIASDPLFKLTENLRTLIHNSYRNNGWGKTSKTQEILGCSFEELQKHLRLLYWPGMTDENYGLWHLDHIIPLSTMITEEEIIKLNHYTNLQPLWADDNLSKWKHPDWDPRTSKHPLPARLLL